MVRRGTARQGVAGGARQDPVRQGEAGRGPAWQAWSGEARRGLSWHVVARQARQDKARLGWAWQGRHGKGGEDMEKSAALAEKIMKRIALVEIHHQTGEWIDEKDIILKEVEDKKTA